MEFDAVLARRRMVRRYRPDPIPSETVEKIARVVRKAPSAGFSQGHRLLVVTGRATRERIAALAEEHRYEAAQGRWISSAPVHMVLGVSEADYHERYTRPDKLIDGKEMEWPAPYWWVDSGALLMLVQLAAIDAGLATGFVTVRHDQELKELLGLPADVAVVGVITLGLPADDAARPADAARLRSLRKPYGDLVRHESWNVPPP
ncbi:MULTISPECIES: nitroreductase family protein [Actinomadura]|uniref:Nitroreductase family protein n=1 Tax=Actinomadura yumaensis TaxID=111807 RepID=A0ABW2CN54_9ACTN|nr:nitroreductase family protein [Actinomadura sp. J1-007]MWK32780.1 nitroreductase [Actinomadura sp. J1-007]